MQRRKGFILMLLALLVSLSLALAGTATPAAAAANSTATWTTQADFESNASTTGDRTTAENIDTSSSPGDVKIGAPKDFATTATITCVTDIEKTYSTGKDRTSIAVIDDLNKTLLKMIPLEAPVAGVVFNSTGKKLYVGQSNSNKILVIDAVTDTVIKTLTVGNAGTGAFASAYNPNANKVYLTNVVDGTVTVIDGVSDTPIGAPIAVTAGATTGTFNTVSNKLYLTGKSNNYVTIIDGDSNAAERYLQVEPIISIIGGNKSESIGLRFEPASKGVTTADNVLLTWNADRLRPGQNIQFQVRTAGSLAGLSEAPFLGPDRTSGTWFELPGYGVTVIPEEDGTDTAFVSLDIPFAAAAELQVKLSYDGVSSPVLHSVGLIYDLTITATAGAGGTISPSGAVEVAFGDNKNFEITPDIGHHIEDVVVDDASQGAISSYEFVDVRSNHTIHAGFAINTYNLRYLAGPNGSISGATQQTVNYGSNGTEVTALPAPHYHFVSWSDGVQTASRTDLNVTSDLTVTANFAIDTFTITVSAGVGGTITPSTTTVAYGASKTFTIAPASGYYLGEVLIDGQHIDPTTTYTFSNVTGDHSIAATFTQPACNAGALYGIPATTTETVSPYWAPSTTPGVTYSLQYSTNGTDWTTAYEGAVNRSGTIVMPANGTYTFRVKVSKTGYADGYTYSAPCVVTLTCNAPTLYGIPSSTTETVAPIWGASTTTGVTYALQYSTDSSNWTTVYEGTGTKPGTIVMPANGTYTFRVKVSRPGYLDGFTYSQPCVVLLTCNAPTLYGMPSSTPETVAPYWGTSTTTGVTYALQYSTDSSNWTTVYQGTGTKPGTIVMPANGTYTFRVKVSRPGYLDGFTYSGTCVVLLTCNAPTLYGMPSSTTETVTPFWATSTTTGVTYALQYSTDNSNWTTTYEGTSNHPGTIVMPANGTYTFRVKVSRPGYLDGFTYSQPCVVLLTCNAPTIYGMPSSTTETVEPIWATSTTTGVTYALQYSTDSSNWTTAYEGTSNHPGTIVMPANGTYTFRVKVSRPGYLDGFTYSQPCEVLLTCNAPTLYGIPSSTTETVTPFWATSTTTGVTYALQYSTDSSNWTTAYEGTSNHPGTIGMPASGTYTFRVKVSRPGYLDGFTYSSPCVVTKP